MLSFTYILLAITIGISIAAFNNNNLLNKLILYPKVMQNPAEYYRFLTSGFIHADWQHLLFNMLTFFFIGPYIETYFLELGNRMHFLELYLLGIIVASIPSFIKNKNNSYYRSLGASGGTSAIIFAWVYISPWSKIYVFFIPMWSILFAILYVGYSIYMEKLQRDNINHNAHLWGAIFGFVFCFLTDPSNGSYFIEQLSHPSF